MNDLEDQMRDKDKEIEALTCRLEEVTADNSTLRRLIVTMRGGASKFNQKPAGIAAGSRMGRPLRQEAPHGMAVPGIQHPPQRPSEDSQNDAAKVCTCAALYSILLAHKQAKLSRTLRVVFCTRSHSGIHAGTAA